jgi:2,3-bisphosphoglycerate-independent phosphoglycerate mutase
MILDGRADRQTEVQDAGQPLQIAYDPEMLCYVLRQHASGAKL